MSQTRISRDVAAAATKAILEEFFWVYPEQQLMIVASRVNEIIEAAAEAGLVIQQRELLKTSEN